MFCYSNFWFLDASKPCMSQITCTNLGTSNALDNNALLGCFYIKSLAATEMTRFSFIFNETPHERLSTHPAMTFAADISGG